MRFLVEVWERRGFRRWRGVIFPQGERGFEGVVYCEGVREGVGVCLIQGWGLWEGWEFGNGLKLNQH